MMAEPTEISRNSGEASVMFPSQGDLQASGDLGGFVTGDKVEISSNCENSIEWDAVDPGRAGALPDVVNGFVTSTSVLVEKRELGFLEFEEQATGKVEGEMPVKCSEKGAMTIQMTDEAVRTDGSPLGKGKGDGDDNLPETRGKRQENEGQKEKRQRRRGGGKARKNKEILNCYTFEKKEKGLQYTKKEMESLRYDQSDYQKKKWIEVFSGLDPLVVQEYDSLVRVEKVRHKQDDAPTFDFDPRLQFLKSVNQVEQIASDHSDNLEEICSQDGAADFDYDDYDDDSDDDYCSIQKPAFVVKGEPDFESGPPLDGLEYLRRVRWEADRFPKVKVAKVDIIKEQSVYMPRIPDIKKCPENLLPLKEWEDSFLADFSELRLRFSENASIEIESVREQDVLVKMLESVNPETIDVLTLTDDFCPSDSSCMAVETSDEVNLPTLSKILKMQSAARTAMLRKRISSVEKMSTISRDDGLWLFALCAAVDCPLDADTSAALRTLLRKCADLRAAKTEPDDELIVLNILVTISGRYFGQLEK